MITISEVVKDIVRKTPFLEEGLARDILNLSAVARMIKPEIEKELMKEIKKGAIVMSLKRLKLNLRKKDLGPRAFFKKPPDLMVRSNLVEITLSNTESFRQKQRKFIEQLKWKDNYFLTITQGIFETTIIASENLEGALQKNFAGEKIVSRFKNLSSITIQLPDNATRVPGIYSFFLRALAWEGINLIEVVSTLNEFSIILENKNVDRAFSILNGLFVKT